MIRWGLPLLVFAASVAVFGPAMSAQFLNFDDDKNITDNYEFRGLSPRHLAWMFSTNKMGHYQPLSWVTLAVDYALWGFEGTDTTHAGGFHRTNIVLHGLTAVAFYFLARRLLALCQSRDREGAVPIGREHPEPLPHGRGSDIESVSSSWLTPAAAGAALLFAVHPLRCESVCWVTERRDVLSGVFFVLTVIAYLRSAAATSPGGRTGWYLASIGLVTLSLLSKAWGIVIPAVLVVLDVWPLGRLSRRSMRRLLVEKIPFAVLSCIFMYLAYWAQSSQMDTLKTASQHGLLQRLAQASYGLMFYPFRTLVPVGLIPIHEIPQSVHEHPLGWPYSAAAGAVLVVTAALVAMRRRFPAGLAAWVCYAAIVSPVLGLTQAGPQFVADRYSYLACMPFALLAGGGALMLAHRRRALGYAGLGILGGVAMVLGVLTWRQSGVWHNSESLWTHTVAMEPDNAVACVNLGIVRRTQKRYAEAIRLYEHSNALETNARNFTNIANCYNALSDDRQGNERERLLDLAAENARLALEWSKKTRVELPEYSMNYGAILVKRGRVAEAHELFEWFVSRKPEHAKGQNNLGLTLTMLGRPAEAVPHLREALRLEPKYANASFNLGLAYKALGRYEEARAAFRRVIEMKGADGEAEQELKRLEGK